MKEVTEINTLIERLQNETPNCGGQYHFTEIDLIDNENVLESIKEFMLRFEQYKNPFYFDERTNENVYLKWRDPNNATIDKIENLEIYIEEKLNYWSNHKTSLDCRENVTDLYKQLEIEFKQKLFLFLNREILVNSYSIGFVDTFYCFGHDHVNDDTLTQTKNGNYILHFGWSS